LKWVSVISKQKKTVGHVPCPLCPSYPRLITVLSLPDFEKEEGKKKGKKDIKL